MSRALTGSSNQKMSCSTSRWPNRIAVARLKPGGVNHQVDARPDGLADGGYATDILSSGSPPTLVFIP